jgi:hypothetical protein
LSEDTQDTHVEEAAVPAFLFEFDHLVARIRDASYDVLQSIFDDVELTPIHFSKYCLQEGPHKTIDLLQTGLGVKKGQPKKVSEELVSGIKMHLDSGAVQVSDELRDVVVQAREREMKVIGVTAIPPQARDALAERLDLSGLGIELVEYSRDLDPYPKADAWLRLTKELNIPASRSISLTTSAQACKSSITADIPTISVPDAFTSFQDFGGAMAVLDTLPEIKLSDYLDREIATV